MSRYSRPRPSAAEKTTNLLTFVMSVLVGVFFVGLLYYAKVEHIAWSTFKREFAQAMSMFPVYIQQMKAAFGL